MNIFASPNSINHQKKIIDRFLELFETADELKNLFNSFFTDKSIVRDMIDLDSKESKEEIAKILVNYMGLNFFNTAGKNYNEIDKKKDGKYLIREKLLEQICKKHNEPEKRKQKILEILNRCYKQNYADFKELSKEKYFLNSRAKKELIKILGFPDIIFDYPPKLNKDEETTTVSKKIPLKPLYDYQTQAVVQISEMMSEGDKQKRILISVPTGAGKTRLTVEAIVNWINDRAGNKIPNAGSQQKEGRIIFWFASTNELCTQAASEFVNIYTQIGTGGEPFNVTRLYGARRRDIRTILDENPGIHIVVTNTEHFQNWLNNEKKQATFQVDQYNDSEIFKKIREQTIAIIIDEAHEAIGNTYRKFLASMGFDFSGRKSEENRNRIVLIGLTATPYRGSGIYDFEGEEKELDAFVKLDETRDPPYFKRLDNNTKRMHKMFDHVYIPLPEKEHLDPEPIPMIDAPSYTHTDDHVRISGLKSFDAFSELKYEWQISGFGTKPIICHDAVFYHKFENPKTYNIKLTVTNKNDKTKNIIHKIKVYPSKKSNSTGNLDENEKFNRVLQERKILCKITYGVIDGPQLHWNKQEIQDWRKGKMSSENEEIIENHKKYNEHICEIISKSITKYGRKRVLLFANGVNHAHNLALVLATKYNLKAKSVDGDMNAGLRRKIIYDFREGEIDVLCNHGILTSGFDVPEIDTLLICRTVGSNALYTQMIGRGQRGLIAGGTNDLWLITAYFKKGKFDDIRLGWEALADTWDTFPGSIKRDLNVNDMKYEISSKIPEDGIVPQKNQGIFECKKCGSKANGFVEASELFGIEEKKIRDSINEYTASQNCHTCNKLGSFTKKSHCRFCKKLTEKHGYDPILTMISSFAIDMQKNTKNVKFTDLQIWLDEKFLNKIPREFFNTRNQSMQRAQELGFMTIEDNLDLKFFPIDDMSNLSKIIDFILHAPQTKNNIDKVIKKHKIIDSSVLPEENKLITVFEELRSVCGHIPTSRQFKKIVQEKKLTDEFKKYNNSDYSKFLHNCNLLLQSDLDLKDSLYEEYFEKCVKENRQITRKQLDEYGQYRISDYEEVFGLFSKFQKKTSGELEKILDNYDEKIKNVDAEFKLIDRDLSILRSKLNKTPHFDDLRIHSEIGSYRYLIQIRISDLRYLRNYDGDKPGKFLRLVKEFFRLKNILKTTPTYEQFIQLTPAEPTANLGELFKFNYNEFLRIIVETPLDQNATGHAEHMAENIFQKLQSLRDESSIDKVNEIIDTAANSHDDLSVSISAWWPDKKKLKMKLKPTRHTST